MAMFKTMCSFLDSTSSKASPNDISPKHKDARQHLAHDHNLSLGASGQREVDAHKLVHKTHKSNETFGAWHRIVSFGLAVQISFDGVPLGTDCCRSSDTAIL